ncbi:MG010, DNA primase-like protein [uncultured Caudovirales phage]|uniref:MG010, DNA primase-like protein n=1 Tax=uncultured Caudovirales phage TaxID=2100421 RepID=A0A6J5MCT9_9CAUD|nr:MG010, DNA primase-like protein [uncultured Caudovirales phage]
MLNSTQKHTVISALSTTLGKYTALKGSELAFYCPFCHHHKQKLQVNTDTQKWHCWTCNSGGKKLTSLLRKLDVDRKTIAAIREIYGDTTYNPQTDDSDTKVFINLPKEYISLVNEPKGFNPEYKHAIHYLNQRGIGMAEIVKYGIGYCKEGLYARRIIVPSYNADGSLNYFISRSYYSEEKMKYKNPPISKNVICLDSQINWKEPIILCEGVFDAIAIRRNAIPLLGKFPSKTLMEKIFLNDVKNIVISLDNDALNEALKVSEYFRKQGINVRLMILKDKDAAEMGYDQFHTELNETKEFGVEELLLTKIKGL